MGTDRSNEFSGPCPCGQGTVEVDFCSPDHGWPTSTPFWREAVIQCSDCSKKYVVEDRDGSFVFVKRAEIDKREALSKKAYAIGSALLKGPKASRLIDLFIALLEKQPSMAAAHRLLTGAGLEHSSVATFRREWHGAKAWVNSHVSASDLAEVMGLLGVKDQEIQITLLQIEELMEAASVRAPAYGKPFYTAHDRMTGES